MRAILRHSPLFALEAVVVDTETTGLDPRSARVVEIGAVVVRNAVVVEHETFRSLVANRPRSRPRQRPFTGSAMPISSALPLSERLSRSSSPSSATAP